jgi:RNA polymerase sigma-70 factor, ECF subfamily
MDRDAEFHQLFEAHRHAVHAYFVGRTADRWAAADLMQEVFLRAWQRLPELVDRSADGQRAWLFAVARNLSIDTYRRERTRTDSEAALGHEPVPAPPSVNASVIAAARAAVVGEAIGRLPEQQRVTLTMAAAGGLTSAEIATALGIPGGNVRLPPAHGSRHLPADRRPARFDWPGSGLVAGLQRRFRRPDGHQHPASAVGRLNGLSGFGQKTLRPAIRCAR